MLILLKLDSGSFDGTRPSGSGHGPNLGGDMMCLIAPAVKLFHRVCRLRNYLLAHFTL